jgi:SAM-dependent MidA family methyltransferase
LVLSSGTGKTDIHQAIIGLIRADGPISFERFMEMALYYPGLGYYAREAAVIGTEGDFYTSPHVHPIFGAAIGRQLDQMHSLLEGGRQEVSGQNSLGANAERFDVVEMGAGVGRLARDILDYLAGAEIYDDIAYTILEPNPAYERRQREILAGHAEKVTWVDSLDKLSPFTGCFLSNELVDALPVRLIEIDGADVLEIFVNAGEDGSLFEEKREAGGDIFDYLKRFAPQLTGADSGDNHIGGVYRTEVNLKARQWLSTVSDRLEAGFVLTIDYGFPASEYYLPFRNAGTLMAYQRHEAIDDPYAEVGLRDLTASVNFSALDAWGSELRLETCGYCSQGPFLASLGIEELLPRFAGSPPDLMEIARIKNLIMPQGLGETHKVLVQRRVGAVRARRGAPGPCAEDGLDGFRLRNEMKKL